MSCSHTESYEQWVDSEGDWKSTGGGHWKVYEVSTLAEYLGNWRCTQCGWKLASDDLNQDY